MSANWNNSYPKPAPVNLEIIHSHVVFGAPGRKCAGSGICRLYSHHAIKHLNIPCPIVEVQLALTPTQLYMCIPRENCTAEMIRQLFAGTHFTIEEEYHLPSWLFRFFKKQYMLAPAGNHPFQYEAGCFWLEIPLLSQ